MGVGFSTLGGLWPRAWRAEQSYASRRTSESEQQRAPLYTSGSEQQRARLEPDIVRLLSQVNRGLHEERTQKHLADGIVAEAEFVTELKEFQALLGEPRQGRGITQVIREMLPGEPKAGVIRELTMPLRIAPLMALIRQIGELPAIDRPVAFEHIRRVVTDWGFPMARRAELFAELARQIGEVDAGDRLRLFDRIHDVVTVAAFPMELRSEPLAALAWQIGHLRAKSSLRSFNRIYDAVSTAEFPMAFRAAPLATLAGVIGSMRQGDEAWTDLDRILAATNILPTQYRTEPLIAVANAICYLRAEQQWDMLNRVLAATAALEEQYRVALLVAIGRQLSAELTGIQRRAMFNLVLTETTGLTDRQIRVAPFKMLVRQIPALSVSDRLSAYNSILSAAYQLALQNRCTLLNTLTYAIPYLAASERRQVLWQLVERIDRFKTDTPQHAMFQQALTTINELPGDDSMLAGELLAGLWDLIPAMPKRHRKAARQGVWRAETLLEMAPDVREHYRDSGWINRLARACCYSLPVDIGNLRPKITPALREHLKDGLLDETLEKELRQYIKQTWPNGMKEARQYWTGSVQCDVGKRNVLLERIDMGGATRWYLVGQNGERLSQYLDRRYSGTLTPDNLRRNR